MSSICTQKFYRVTVFKIDFMYCRSIYSYYSCINYIYRVDCSCMYKYTLAWPIYIISSGLDLTMCIHCLNSFHVYLHYFPIVFASLPFMQCINQLNNREVQHDRLDWTWPFKLPSVASSWVCPRMWQARNLINLNGEYPLVILMVAMESHLQMEISMENYLHGKISIVINAKFVFIPRP